MDRPFDKPIIMPVRGLDDLIGILTTRGYQVWGAQQRDGALGLAPITASRYRQWVTHKLAHWHDQFGRSGCVGCGRCIGWCPVGIDITAEVAALAASEQGASRVREDS